MKHTLLLLLTGMSLSLYAQTDITVIGADLRGPVGIDREADGTIWVAESGTGNNDGAVSVIWPDGTQERVIDSIFSVFDTMAGEVIGPLRVQVLNDTYIGVYTPITAATPAPSVSVFSRADFSQGGGMLRLSDAVSTIRVGEYVLGSAGKPESNPYTLVHNGCDMYIADAAANAIIHRDGLTGAMEVFAEFPQFENPLPFGPPFIDVVPTRILRDPDGGFLVSSLTGFPFIDHASNIYRVSDDGDVSVAYDNLTLVTDMAWSPDGDGVYALQFARFSLDSIPPFYFNSAQIMHLRDDLSRDTIASGFGPSPGLAVDGDGNCYVTHLFLGLVLKIEHETSDVHDASGGTKDVNIYPNPAQDRLFLDYELSRSTDVEVAVFDMLGRMVYKQDMGIQSGGPQRLEIDTRPWANGHSEMNTYLVVFRHGDKLVQKIAMIGGK